MTKRAHLYRLTLEHVAGAKPDDLVHDPITIEFDNHDDIFAIIERLRQRDPFQSKDQATQFAIGLKLFSEIMLKNKQHPLFEDFAGAFGAFMKKLKSPA
jgi:hypothetical protein